MTVAMASPGVMRTLLMHAIKNTVSWSLGYPTHPPGSGADSLNAMGRLQSVCKFCQGLGSSRCVAADH